MFQWVLYFSIFMVHMSPTRTTGSEGSPSPRLQRWEGLGLMLAWLSSLWQAPHSLASPSIQDGSERDNIKKKKKILVKRAN